MVLADALKSRKVEKDAACAAMKRPAAAPAMAAGGDAKKLKKEPGAKGAAVKPEPGMKDPSWHDAKSRHCILFLTGYKGPGSTKTLTCHNEKERLQCIADAKALVQDRSNKYYLAFNF